MVNQEPVARSIVDSVYASPGKQGSLSGQGNTVHNALVHPHAKFIHFTIQTFAEYLRSVRRIYHYKDLIDEEKAYIENSVRQFHDDLDDMDGDEFE